MALLTKSQIDAAFAAYNPATYPHTVNPNGDQTDWLLPPYTKAGNTGKNQWDEFTFTLRVQVHDTNGRLGEDRKSLQSHHDDSSGANGTAVPGFPKELSTDGASDPTMADLVGNNQQVLVFGTNRPDPRDQAGRQRAAGLAGAHHALMRQCPSRRPLVSVAGPRARVLRRPAGTGGGA